MNEASVQGTSASEGRVAEYAGERAAVQLAAASPSNPNVDEISNARCAVEPACGGVTLLTAIAGAILCLSGCFKLVSLLTATPIMRFHAPLLPISYAGLFAVLGSVEVWLGISAVVWPTSGVLRRALVALASAFATYRAVLLVVGHGGACKCLGTVLGWLGFGEATESWLTWAWFLVFCGVSWCAYCLDRPSGQRSVRAQRSASSAV